MFSKNQPGCKKAQMTVVGEIVGRVGLGDFAGGFFQELVDKSLVGLGLFGGAAAELAEEFWGDAKMGSGEC